MNEEQNNNVPEGPTPEEQAKAQQQEKEHDANKETARVAIKGAETYFTGGASGGAITDTLAKTEVGNQVLDTAATVIDKNPVLNQTSQALNDSGALNAADQGISMASGAGGAAGAAGGAAGGAAAGAGKAAGASQAAGGAAKGASAAPKAPATGKPTPPQGGSTADNLKFKDNKAPEGDFEPDYSKNNAEEQTRKKRIEEDAQRQAEDQAKDNAEQEKVEKQKEEIEDAADEAQAEEQHQASDQNEEQEEKKKGGLIKLLIMTNPVLALTIASVLFLVFIFGIFLITIILQGEGQGSGDGGSGPSAWSCSYKDRVNEYSDVEVEVVNCSATESNYRVLETVPLEKYFLGVALAEAGPDAPIEALKAQIIAVRNFSFTRNKGMCPGNPDDCFYGYNRRTNKIRMRACTNDQVYWDYTQDIYTVPSNPALYSPEVNSSNYSARLWKRALSIDQQINVEGIANVVVGKILIDSNGDFAQINYNSVQTDQFIALANQGMDYTQILLTVYGTGNHIESATCEYDPGDGVVAAGDYANWKQWDSRWASTPIGSCTLGRVGCMITSIAIQIARSGASTNLVTFNPGTFATALNNNGGVASNCNYMGIAYVRRIVPTATQVSSESIYGRSESDILSYMRGKIENGCRMVVEVKGYGTPSQVGQHWVAIDDISTKGSNYSKLFMWDPGRNATDLFAQYGNRVTVAKCLKF